MSFPPCDRHSHRRKCTTHERSWHHLGLHIHTIPVGRCMIPFPCAVHLSSASQREDLAMSAPLIRLGRSVRIQLYRLKEFRPLPGNLRSLMRRGKSQGLDSREVAKGPLLRHPLSTSPLRLVRVIATTLLSLVRPHHQPNLIGIYRPISSMGTRLHRWRSIPPQLSPIRNRCNHSNSNTRASNPSTITLSARHSFASLSSPVVNEPASCPTVPLVGDFSSYEVSLQTLTISSFVLLCFRFQLMFTFLFDYFPRSLFPR